VESSTVLIRGDAWKIEDIREEVEWCRNQSGWTHGKWTPWPSSPDGSKRRSQIHDHGHCLVCWWTLSSTEDPETGMGWTYNSKQWLCNECYSKFVANDGLRGVV
jgi:hypothetical protein